MVLDRLLDAWGFRSPGPRLIVGAGLVALTVSLATSGALWLLGMKAGAGLAGGLGAAAAAAFGVSSTRSKRGTGRRA